MHIQEEQEGLSRQILASQLHLSPWEIIEQIPLEVISKHTKNKKATQKNRDGFPKQ